MCGQGKGDLYEVLSSQSGQDMFSGFGSVLTSQVMAVLS